MRNPARTGIRDLTFRAILRHFEDELFDIRTGRGWLVVFNPERIKSRSGISYIALGDSPEQALHRAEVDLPARLHKLLRFRRRRTGVSLP